jgi:hypothetical protein
VQTTANPLNEKVSGSVLMHNEKVNRILIMPRKEISESMLLMTVKSSVAQSKERARNADEVLPSIVLVYVLLAPIEKRGF